MNKIKKGDTVVVISGSHKKKVAVVKTVLPKESKVVLQGVNVKKVVRTVGNEKKLVEREFPMHISNIALQDAKTKKPTRVGISVDSATGNKTRISKKSGAVVK